MGIPRGSERDDVGGTQRVGVPAHGDVATDGDDRVGLVVAPVQRALHDPVPEEKVSAEAPNLRATVSPEARRSVTSSLCVLDSSLASS